MAFGGRDQVVINYYLEITKAVTKLLRSLSLELFRALTVRPVTVELGVARPATHKMFRIARRKRNGRGREDFVPVAVMSKYACFFA